VAQQGSSSSCAGSTRPNEAGDAPAGEQAGTLGSSGQLWLEEAADWQECVQDSTGLIVPLYELVSCAFELQSKGFVRRPVITLVRQLLSLVAGGAIDEFVQKALANGLSEESISKQITRLQTQLWPGGVWFARAAAAAAGSAPPKGPPITAERYLDWTPPADAGEVAEQVRQRLLASSVPAPLLALLGKNAYIKCMGDIYGVMQSKTLMYNLGLTLVETLLVAMFPEVKGTVRAMHQSFDG
jgi:sorting nexin-13